MKRFSIFAIIVGLTGVSAWASKRETRFVCATYHLTTSTVFVETDDGYELKVLHHLGIQHMPIHDGMVTSFDLDMLKKMSDLFQKLGDEYTILFQKDQCRGSGLEWTCVKSEPARIGGLDVQSLMFTLSPRRVITKRIDYQTHRTNLSIAVDGFGYSLPMSYPWEECVAH